jgi:hypothetical protein
MKTIFALLLLAAAVAAGALAAADEGETNAHTGDEASRETFGTASRTLCGAMVGMILVSSSCVSLTSGFAVPIPRIRGWFTGPDPSHATHQFLPPDA